MYKFLKMATPYVGGRIMRRRMRQAGFIDAQTAQKILESVGRAVSKGKSMYSKYKDYIDPAVNFGTRMLSTYAKRNDIDPSKLIGVKQEPNSTEFKPAPNMNKFPTAKRMSSNPATNAQKPKSVSEILRSEKIQRYRKPKAYIRKFGAGDNLMRGPIA